MWLNLNALNIQGVDAERMIHIVVIFEPDRDSLTHTGGDSINIELNIIRFNRYCLRRLTRNLRTATRYKRNQSEYYEYACQKQSPSKSWAQG